MAEWIRRMLEEGGYPAVAFVMFLENIVPPIPSEVVMPLAGMNAASGDMSLWGVMLAGTAGAFAGAAFWYGLARLAPRRALRRLVCRSGRWLGLRPSDLDRAEAWFQRHGATSVFVGRLVPGLRTFISAPAGLLRMPVGPFCAYTLAGATLWTCFLAGVGYALGSASGQLLAWIDPVANLVLALSSFVWLWRVATWSADEAADDCEDDDLRSGEPRA